MATKFTTSTNIIRDTNRDIKYIPTPNAIQIVNQISNDFKKGIRSFSIIGSYGTGKSSFLWAIEQTLKSKKKYFGFNIINNPKIDFIKIVGEYQSLKESLAEYLELKQQKNPSENIFSEIYNRYHDLGNRNPLLVIVIDEFGKFLEFAAQNNPEKELYFIQQFTEFINNSDNNILLLTTIHQNFDAYAIHLQQSQRQEWTKVKGRFREVTFNEPVEQLLYLASEHLSENQFDKKELGQTQKLLNLLIKSKVFTVNDKYLNEVAGKLYPLDIISSYVLTLSLQKYGQNERSLFSFLESTDHTGLYQHSILRKDFYSVAEVYDYLVFNYYSFLNSRYNPDFSAWKSIRASLEKAEAFFEENINAYCKIIKTIGLLSINAQAGAILDKAFFTTYADKSLGIKNAGDLIEELERRKIILYRNYNNRYVLFEGTDLDIQTALYEAGNKIDEITDVVTLLNKYYTLSPILAKKAMYETGTPRLFEYRISSHPTTDVPAGEVDGYINLVFNEKNILQAIKEVSASQKDAVLYCYYRNSKEIKDLLFEIEKTQKVIEENGEDKIAIAELKNIILHQRNLLNHKILNSFYNQNTKVDWVFNGETVNIRSLKEFNSFLSHICKTIYSKTPTFNNELVNKHKISPSIHTAKKSYFKALANDWDIPQLGFLEDKFPPEKTIYLSLLENNGIQLYDDNYNAEIIPNSKNGFDTLWNTSVEFINNSRTAKRPLAELVEQLSKKPFKLKQGLIEFWIPTFIFIKRDEFALFNNGIYVPNISEDILELIAKVPEEFEIKSFALEGVKLDIFNSYRKFLNQSTPKQVNNQSFIETIKPFLVFYRNLHDYSKETQRLSKQCLDIRNAIANSKDPEQSFFEDFPTALGYSIPKIQKDRNELQNYILKLQDSIKELRNSYDELVGRFEGLIQTEIADENTSFDEYKSLLQKRYKGIHKHLLLNNQKSFIQRLDSQIEDRNAWLNSIAQSLINKPLTKLRDEDEPLLFDRFKEMILSLDSLNTISKTKFDENKEFVFDLRINSYQDGMVQKVIRLSKNKNSSVESLKKQIKALLSKDKTIDLAAITSILKDLL